MAPARLTVALAWAVPPVPVQLKVKLVALLSAPVLWLPAVALVPLQPPEAVQDVAFVEFQVKVLLPPLLTLVGAADNVTAGAGVGLVTETEAFAWAVPPAPVQLSVYEALAFNAPVLALPDTTFAPLQAPVAVQDVAFVEFQVKVLLPPLLTLAGAADNVTVGAGVGLVTETEALAWAVPPAPVQLSVYEALAFNAPVFALPEISFAPLQPPDAVHEVAFVEFQVNVLLPPLAMVVGDADNVTAGAGVGLVTVTEVLARAVPPYPVQVIVKVEVAFSAPLLSLPETAFAPLQAPDAVHEFARVLDQVKLLVRPGLTELGLAVSVTVGARLLRAASASAAPPPHDMTYASASGANRNWDFMPPS